MKIKIIIIMLLSLLLTGCDKSKQTVEDTAATELFSNPQVQVTESSTERDYGDKEIVNGSWRYVAMDDETKGGVAYIPLFKTKIAGVYDLEDCYNQFGTGKGAVGNQALWATNQPKGTIQGHIAGGERSYVSKNRRFTLENGVETKYVSKAPVHGIQLIDPIWYTVNTRENQGEDWRIEIIKSDIVCLTFALYTDTSQIPGIQISLYGADEATVMQYYKKNETLGIMDFSDKQLYGDYLAGTASLTKLGSFDVQDSGVCYADLKELSKGVDYFNIITVIEFDSFPDDLSYYMTNCFAYDIQDSSVYEAWKKENEGKFFE